MAYCQPEDLATMQGKKCIIAQKKCANTLLDDGRESSVDLAFGAGTQNSYFPTEHACCGQDLLRFILRVWTGGIHKQSGNRQFRYYLKQVLIPLCRQRYGGVAGTSEVAAWPIEPSNE